MTLINQAGGIINADQNPNFFQSGQLIVNTSGDIATNAGIMKATAAGGLLIQNTAVNNTGGTILAAGATAHVDLSGSTIQGGTLATSGGGVIQTVSGNSGLDGITFGAINNTGMLLVNDQTQLDLNGIINNTGIIVEDQESAGGSTRIRIAGQAVTLQGGGQLQMSDNGQNEIYGTSSQNTLTNVNNTISGAGQIGTGTSMFLVNLPAGIINGNQSDRSLDPEHRQQHDEQHRHAGRDRRRRRWSSRAPASTTPAARSWPAAPARSLILQSAYIEGGLLTTTGGGAIHADDRGSALDGITEGTVTNSGCLQINNTPDVVAGRHDQQHRHDRPEAHPARTGNTDLRVVGDTVTLTGGGKVLMSNNIDNRIYGSNNDFNLVNLNNTISGAGQIGAGTSMFLFNKAAGIINANQKAAMVVNLGSNLITNAGDDGVDFGAPRSTAAWCCKIPASTMPAAQSWRLARWAHVDLQSAYIEGGTLATSGGGLIQTAQNTTSTLDGITSGTLANKGTIRVNDTSTLQLVGTINNTGTILQSASAPTATPISASPGRRRR